MHDPIIPMSLQNKLLHGETDFAEMGGWNANARQLRKVANLLTDLVADCVIERRQGEANEEHAYARIRAQGHYELSRELMAVVSRLAELEEEARRQEEEAREEYELGRQAHLAKREAR